MEANSRKPLLLAPVKVVAAVARMAASVYSGITRDGTLAAAFRQGADEIGVALKAFPESIQTQEAGTILSPTQGEIAADRSPQMVHVKNPRASGHGHLPTAGDIGRQGQGGVHGQQMGKEHLRSAGDIGRDRSSSPQADRSQQQEREHSHGRE